MVGTCDKGVQTGEEQEASPSHTVTLFVPWPALEPGEGQSVLCILVRDTLRLRLSPPRESLLYHQIAEPEEGEPRRLESPPPLPPPRTVTRRLERRRKNLWRHLGLEAGAEGEQAVWRLREVEGRTGKKDLAKFLGVEVPRGRCEDCRSYSRTGSSGSRSSCTCTCSYSCGNNDLTKLLEVKEDYTSCCSSIHSYSTLQSVSSSRSLVSSEQSYHTKL